MDDKKKNTLPLYIIFGGIIFVLVMLFCGNLAYYRMEDLIPAVSYSLEDMSRLVFHFSFDPVSLKYYLGGIVTVVLVFTAFWVNEEKYRHDAGGVEAGSAKWNKNIKGYNRKFTEPFNKTSSEGENNMILSQNISLSLDDRKTRRNNNVLVYGPAGTGKSRFLMKPNILQNNCSFLVCDPSGELFRDTYKELKEAGYKIKVFNLVNMRYSNYYNPFAYIRDDAGIGVLVDTLIDNTNQEENASKGDPFWEKSEKALLTACIYYLKDYCPESEHTFAMVLKLIRLAQLDENAKVTLESPLDKLFSGKAVIKDGEYFELKNRDEIERMAEKIKDSLAWKNYQTFKLAGVKTLKSILISAAVRLNPFNVPEIENLTSRDNLDLADIGDERTAIFAIIPQSNKTYNFLVSMMFAQLFETLYYKAEHSKTGRLNSHVRLLMDEFVNSVTRSTPKTVGITDKSVA